MLELEKIKEIEKPTKLDQFKKSIQKTVENNKEIKELDFFKRSTIAAKKSTKISKIISIFPMVCTIYLLQNVYIEENKKNLLSIEDNKAMQIYHQISNNLDNNNTLDPVLFESLTQVPSRNGTILSSILISKILYRDSHYEDNKYLDHDYYKNYKKLNSQTQKQIFEIYSQNWKNGLNKFKNHYSDCSFNISCHLNGKGLNSVFNKIEDMAFQNLVYIKHPDIFNAELELNNLKVKHNVFFDN